MAARVTVPLLRWNPGSPVSSVSVSNDGLRIASGTWDHLVCIWDIHTGVLVLDPLKGHTDIVSSVAWSHNDALIISGSHDSTICMWDTRTGLLIGNPLTGHTGPVRSVAISLDDTRIFSGSADKSIRVWDIRTGLPIGQPLEGHNEWIQSIALSPDSTRIASGAEDKAIRLWDAHTGAPVGEPFTGHVEGIYSLAFSSDSTRIVSGSADHTVRLWDAHTGDLIGEPLRHERTVWSVAFSPDNTRIASGSKDLTIRFWDAYTGAPLAETLKGHTGVVRSVAFSPDCTRVVSGSYDETICVWEAPWRTTLIHSRSYDIDTPMLDAVHDNPGSVSPPRFTRWHSSEPILRAARSSDVMPDAMITPVFDMVTSKMASARVVLSFDYKHGCSDLSSFLDMSQSSAVITSGGFGDVRRLVVDNSTVVAIKTLRLHVLLKDDDKAVKRVVREVYMWSQLRHPNVQELLGIVVFQDTLGMVSPWMEQGDLQQYIEAHPEVARHPLCVQVASGVSYLHSIGMVHGDLKANNILVADDGTLKISDFDHAILPEASLRFSATTRPGGGTLRWMAPELLEAEGDEDEELNQSPAMRSTETDMYALGMTILEIATGDVPYAEYKSDMGIYRAIHTRKPPKRPKELPASDKRSESVWVLLLRCWDHEPSARPDAAGMLAALNGLTD